ncbi:MAG: hypothetical protein ACRDKW_10980, partial [Actinomycetota bacterium]
MTPVRPLRRVCSLLALLLGLALLAGPALAQEEPAGGQGAAPAVVDFIQADGVIDPPVGGYLLRRIAEAGRDGADLAVLQLNTRGGLDAPVREIVDAIRASTVPVVTWVSPSGAGAAGAGSWIAMAGHVVAMAPGTELGPVLPLNLAAPRGGRATDADDARTLLRSAGGGGRD